MCLYFYGLCLLSFCDYFPACPFRMAIYCSYFMWISCFINAAKSKPQNPLTFRANADPGLKCKKRKKGLEAWKKWRKIPRYIFFSFTLRNRFCVFRDKYIASLSILSFEKFWEMWILGEFCKQIWNTCWKIWKFENIFEIFWNYFMEVFRIFLRNLLKTSKKMQKKLHSKFWINSGKIMEKH